MPQTTHSEGIAQVLRKDVKLVQIVDAALADATRRSGPHLACRPGCTQCCHGAFAIGPLDALRLRSGMEALAETDPGRAASVRQRANLYLAEFGPSFPGNLATGILGRTPKEEEAFDDFANEAPCPALDPTSGLCDLYSARPMTCRIFGPPVRLNPEPVADAEEDGLAVCELCFNEASPEEILACEMKVPRKQEQALVAELEKASSSRSAGDETIVAFCLV